MSDETRLFGPHEEAGGEITGSNGKPYAHPRLVLIATQWLSAGTVDGRLLAGDLLSEYAKGFPKAVRAARIEARAKVSAQRAVEGVQS